MLATTEHMRTPIIGAGEIGDAKRTWSFEGTPAARRFACITRGI
jgi:hypothetical protein